MNLNSGTRTLLVALTVAGSALVAPAMALAETPAPEGPIGPVDVANPLDEPEPEPCDDPGDCLTNPTEGTTHSVGAPDGSVTPSAARDRRSSARISRAPGR
jgi:hypothetical protein